MVDTSEIAQIAEHAASVETFEWRDLRFHVVTPDPLTDEQIRAIRRAAPKVASVGRFADLLAVILGRHVRILAVRPSPDVSFEVGR